MAGSAPVAVSPPASAVGKNANYLAPLSVLTSLFFMWGFLTSLNDVLSPHLQALFDLNYFQAGLIQTAFFLAYFVVSTPSGRVVEKFGYKNGIIIGLIVAGIGCLIFYPAAGLRSFNVFLVALFVLASGITLLQVAANPFVAVLGKPETASARLTLTQAFNSLATYLGPKFGAAFILATVVKSATEIKQMTPQAAEAYRVTEASSVQNPYLGLAATLGVLAVAIAMSKLPRIQGANVEGAAAQETDDATHASAWSYRHLVLGAAAIFLYVGGEVTIGNFLVRYFKQPELGGLPETVGANYLANYWGCAMVGRFLGSLLTLRLFKPRKVLAAHAFLVVALILTTMASTGKVAMWSIILVGLFNSIMFPTIFTLAIDGLGKHTRQGSEILCMAIVGGAIISPLQGLVADRIGIHYSFVVPAICYLYIAWYGLRGHPPAVKAPAV